MPDLAVVTVVTRNYLHYARALAVSVRETNPTVPVYICLVDRPPQPYDPSAEPGTVFFADELGTPDWKRFAFQYDGLELACALKPFAMRRVLDEGLRGVLYLDSDGLVYGPLSGIRERLGSGPVALTPHLDSPLPEDGRSPSEATILRAGVFNGGFVAVSGTPGGADSFPGGRSGSGENASTIRLPVSLSINSGWTKFLRFSPTCASSAGRATTWPIGISEVDRYGVMRPGV